MINTKRLRAAPPAANATRLVSSTPPVARPAAVRNSRRLMSRIVTLLAAHELWRGQQQSQRLRAARRVRNRAVRCGAQTRAEPLRTQQHCIPMRAQLLPECVSPLDSLQDSRTAVPVRTPIGPARGRTGCINALSEKRKRAARRVGIILGKLKPTQAGDDVLARCLELRESLRPAFLEINERAVHAGQVPAAVAKGARKVL